MGRQWLLGHLSPQHAPGPWHDTIQVIASTPKGYPASLTVGMSEVVGYPHLCLDPAHADMQMGQRIPCMGIAAMHADNHIRCKRQDQGRKERVHHFAIRIILGERRQGDVDRVTPSRSIAYLEHVTCAREEIAPRFVKRDRHDTRLIIKRLLHPVTVMRIKVDIHDFRFGGLEEMSYGYCTVVVNTEARSALFPRMMEPAGGMKHVAGTLLLSTSCSTLGEAPDRTERDQSPTPQPCSYFMPARYTRSTSLSQDT